MGAMRLLIELLISPFFLCFLLLCLCTLFLWCRKSVSYARAGLVLVCLVLLALSTGWLPRYLTYQLEAQYPWVAKTDPQVKWVVVLSGGQSQALDMPANDLLSGASIKRLVEGVRLLNTLPDARLILSGGGTVGDQPEALLLNELAHWFSIPSQKLVLETNSINTADQARELKAIVKTEPFYLVTSAVHMPRSMALCQKEGLHPIAAPTDFTLFWNTQSLSKLIIPNTYNMAYFSIAMHEILGKVWVFWLRGN